MSVESTPPYLTASLGLSSVVTKQWLPAMDARKEALTDDLEANTKEIVAALKDILDFSEQASSEELEKTYRAFEMFSLESTDPLYEQCQACYQKLNQLAIQRFCGGLTEDNVFDALKQSMDNGAEDEVSRCIKFLSLHFCIGMERDPSGKMHIQIKEGSRFGQQTEKLKNVGIPFFVSLANRYPPFSLNGIKNYVAAFGSTIDWLSLDMGGGEEVDINSLMEIFHCCKQIHTFGIFNYHLSAFPENFASTSLKILQISSESLTKLPDLSKFPNLEKLELSAPLISV